MRKQLGYRNALTLDVQIWCMTPTPSRNAPRLAEAAGEPPGSHQIHWEAPEKHLDASVKLCEASGSLNEAL